MDEKIPAAEPNTFSGQMLLYERPELLSKERHAELGLSATSKPFDFASKTRSVPIVLSEIVTAQKFYPVVFTSSENPDLVAALGVLDNVNEYVDENGQWEKNTFVPSYVDCYPFALARSEDDQLAVIIDRASAAVSKSPKLPFFDGDELSPDIRARVDICGRFEAERRQTQQFCKRVKELDLLSKQNAMYQAHGGDEEQVVAEYTTIDLRKLAALSKDTLHELHGDGLLSPIYAQIFSLQNWRTLIMRRATRLAALRT